MDILFVKRTNYYVIYERAMFNAQSQKLSSSEKCACALKKKQNSSQHKICDACCH